MRENERGNQKNTHTSRRNTIQITIYHGANTVTTLPQKKVARLLDANGGIGPSSDCDKSDPKHCVGYEACTDADLNDVKDNNDTYNGNHQWHHTGSNHWREQLY